MKNQISKERGMTDGILEIQCRGALVPFQLLHMQIPDYKNENIEHNPIALTTNAPTSAGSFAWIFYMPSSS